MSECATPHCTNPATWITIEEGRRYGGDAPRRCRKCCDHIGTDDPVTEYREGFRAGLAVGEYDSHRGALKPVGKHWDTAFMRTEAFRNGFTDGYTIWVNS